MVRILITGSSGYLGQNLLRSFCSKESSGNYDIVAAFGTLETFDSDFGSSSLSENIPGVTVQLVGGVDLSDSSGIRSFMSEHGPFDVVVNLAALSSPATCQKSVEYATAVNVPTAFLDAVSDVAGIIQLSTDQVYDGGDAPYKEDDETKPINVYGETKLAFEKELFKERRVNAVALRSSLILGPDTPFRCRKQTFLQFVRDRLKGKIETDFFTDEYRSVVYVGDVVRVIRHFIDSGIGKGKSGVYNMGGSDRVSRLDIAQAVARHCNLNFSCAKGVARAALPPGNVPSPQDISMDISKLEEATGIKMMGLDEMMTASFPEKV